MPSADSIVKIIDWVRSLFGFDKETQGKITIRSQQRSQQIINNYFLGPGVGNPQELLSGRSDQTLNFDIQEAGRQLISKKDEGILFTEEAIHKLGLGYQRIFAANEISRNASTYLDGAIFALGSRKLDNPEWKEHCASSLRELFHHWDGAPERSYRHFRKAFGSDDAAYPPYKEHEDFCKKLKSYYQYFSGKCHHNPSNSLFALQALRVPEQIKDVNDTDDMFFAVVRSLLLELKEFTERYPS